MNEIIHYTLNILNENQYVVEKNMVDWNDIIKDLELFHNEVANIVLNKEALYFFSTNNNDSLFLKNELTQSQKKMLQGILEALIKNPAQYFSDLKKRNKLYVFAEKLKSIEEIEKFCKKYGIDFKIKNGTVDKERIRLLRKLSADFGFGLFGEILLYIIIEYLMKKRKLLLSKISFITAPGTFSHGSDGVFCEYEKKILFFGEAKFTSDLNSGIEQAVLSLKDYETRLKNDITFIVNHNRDLKNGYQECIDIIDKEELEQFEKHIIVFVLHGKEYENDEIKEILDKSKKRLENLIDSEIKIELISFPIIEKESLKEKIAYKVEHYDKEC